jgi:hypothetical protein
VRGSTQWWEGAGSKCETTGSGGRDSNVIRAFMTFNGDQFLTRLGVPYLGPNTIWPLGLIHRPRRMGMNARDGLDSASEDRRV